MSYAGPASRTPRAPNINPALGLVEPNPRASARPPKLPLPPRPKRRAPSHTRDHRATAVFIAGLTIGLAVGAGIALLVAPQDGADTRRAVTRATRRLARRGHDAWDDLRDELHRYRRQRRNSRNRADASSL